MLHYEGLEQLQGHLLGETALIELEFGSDHDDGTSGVVDALAEEVLTEPSLLALEKIREALELTGAGTARDGTAAAAVVDEGVDSFLEHALLVAHDDIRRCELAESLETVVSVDDSAVQVIEVAGGEASAVQLDHGAEIRRDHRDDREDHPLGALSGCQECFHDFQSLCDPGALLSGGALGLLTQLCCHLIEVDLLQQLLDGFRAHLGLELVLVALQHVAVLSLVQQLALLQRGQAGIGDDIGCEVQDLLQVAGAEIQHEAYAGRNSLEVPDVGHRSCKLDVAHALAAHLGSCDFNAAAVADLALVAYPLVFSAVALPVLSGSEYPLAEESVTFGLECAVVDGLGLLYLAV